MKKVVLPLVVAILSCLTGQSVLATPPSPMTSLVNTPNIKAEAPTPSAAVPPPNTVAPEVAAENNETLTTVEAPAAIDCTYSLPENSAPTSVSKETILEWANYAAMKTFTYDFRNYDKQFKELQSCYTTAGWEGYMKAVNSSNNLKITQEEHLFVSAKINGTSQLVSAPSGDDATWVVRVPVLATYQNQDREVTQDMYVDLTIKTNYGVPTRLGVNQIVASPKTTAENANTKATT
jgi:hypothetical protein